MALYIEEEQITKCQSQSAHFLLDSSNEVVKKESINCYLPSLIEEELLSSNLSVIVMYATSQHFLPIKKRTRTLLPFSAS